MKEKKPKTKKVTYYTLLVDTTGMPTGHQENAIIEAIKAKTVDGKAERMAVLSGLTSEALLSRQTPSKVLGYYLAMLQGRGIVERTIVVEEVKPKSEPAADAA